MEGESIAPSVSPTVTAGANKTYGEHSLYSIPNERGKTPESGTKGTW